MSTFAKIKALQPGLSNSEAKLAEFTLGNSEKIRELSSVELAKAAGVSQSSVVKFSQKLGYKGFPTFKLAIVDDLNRQEKQPQPETGLITSSDSLKIITEKLLANQQSILSQTQDLNTPEQFDSAIQAIKNAKKVLICASGSSYTMASDFAIKLQKLGIPALAHNDEMLNASFVATMGKDDLVIAISYSGKSTNILNVIKQADKNNCAVLTISRYGRNALSDYANIELSTVSGEEPIKHSSVFVRTSQSYIIDVLFIGITQSNLHWQKRAERANEYMTELRQA